MNNKTLAIFAGVNFALSAYFRSQFEMFFMVATVNFFIISIFLKIISIKSFKVKSSSNIVPVNYRVPLICIFLSLLTFQVFTVPYKMYTHHRIGSYLWVQTSLLMLENNFTPSSYFEEHGGGFLKNSGANIGCQVDPTNCLIIRKQLDEAKISREQLKKYAMITFLKHPFRWLELKVRLLPVFWFNFPNYSFINNFFNYIFIGCFVFSLGCILFTIKSMQSIITYWLSSSICFAYTIIFMISHYETRYFYFFKFYFFIMAILCLVRLLSLMRWNKCGVDF
jgi:hypothetical protein